MVSREGVAGNGNRLVVLLAAFCSVAFAAEPVPDPAELPRIPGMSLAEAQKAFRVREGFRVELAAGEPEVVDPVAIAFDERERMFVVEMRGYPERRDEALGRIKLLEDTDRDGRYEKATVFAEGLKWPTGVVCWKDGVFVTASPDLLYLADRDGDGVAEEKRVVFTGFGGGQKRLNMQALVNGLQWGPDGRIYGATASNGGVVKGSTPGAKAIDLRGADFSFDPAKLDLRKESGTAQYGLTFDDYGRRYVCSNSQHVMAVMYSWPSNGVAGLPHPLVNIAVDGGAAEVFRVSRVEPWRVVRTRWRVQGKVRGPVEGGGRAAGYFTSASGLTVYRGDAFPEEYRGNVFVGDVGSNLVHRKVIGFPDDRVQPVARRAAGEEKREFLASPDNWFRPVQCANGPDGALYIVDMCRETIEHPWSIPESIKKHLDLYSGNDRGRIWRVVPEGFARPAPVVWAKPGTPQMAVPLERDNGWTQDTWSRLAGSSLDANAAGGLVRFIEDPGNNERWRLHVLRVVHQPRTPGRTGRVLLSDSSSELRRHAVRMMGPAGENLAAHLGSDPDPRVRFEVALRALDEQFAINPAQLSKLAAGAAGDRWMIRTVAVAAKRRGVLGVVVQAQGSLNVAKLLIEAGKMATNDPQLSSLWARAAQVADDRKAPGEEREAARWLLGARDATPVATLWEWVDGDDRAVAEIGADALLRRKPAGWEGEILARWKRMAPALREKFLSQMGAGEVLAGLEKGVILPSELGFQRTRGLLSQRDEKLRKRAEAMLGKLQVVSRQEALDHYRPALLLKGVAASGKEVFTQRCAVCHEGRDGQPEIGPATATLRNKGAPMLLENLIEPDREIAPQYLLWEIVRKDGGKDAGMIGEEGAREFSLFRADGSRERIPRESVDRLTNLNRSLMPPGLEAGLSLQEMADLLAYLSGPPS